MNGRAAQAGRWVALLVTNAIKVGGLYLAVRTAVTEPQPNVVQIGEACFMMTGAQVTEDAILKLVGRMFGGHTEHDGHDKTEGSK